MANKNGIDCIVVIFDNSKVYTINPWFEHNLFNPTCKNLVIIGNGATIKVFHPKKVMNTTS